MCDSQIDISMCEFPKGKFDCDSVLDNCFIDSQPPMLLSVFKDGTVQQSLWSSKQTRWENTRHFFLGGKRPKKDISSCVIHQRSNVICWCLQTVETSLGFIVHRMSISHLQEVASAEAFMSSSSPTPLLTDSALVDLYCLRDSVCIWPRNVCRGFLFFLWIPSSHSLHVHLLGWKKLFCEEVFFSPASFTKICARIRPVMAEVHLHSSLKLLKVIGQKCQDVFVLLSDGRLKVIRSSKGDEDLVQLAVTEFSESFDMIVCMSLVCLADKSSFSIFDLTNGACLQKTEQTSCSFTPFSHRRHVTNLNSSASALHQIGINMGRLFKTECISTSCVAQMCKAFGCLDAGALLLLFKLHQALMAGQHSESANIIESLLGKFSVSPLVLTVLLHRVRLAGMFPHARKLLDALHGAELLSSSVESMLSEILTSHIDRFHSVELDKNQTNQKKSLVNYQERMKDSVQSYLLNTADMTLANLQMSFETTEEHILDAIVYLLNLESSSYESSEMLWDALALTAQNLILKVSTNECDNEDTATDNSFTFVCNALYRFRPKLLIKFLDKVEKTLKSSYQAPAHLNQRVELHKVAVKWLSHSTKSSDCCVAVRVRAQILTRCQEHKRALVFLLQQELWAEAVALLSHCSDQSAMHSSMYHICLHEALDKVKLDVLIFELLPLTPESLSLLHILQMLQKYEQTYEIDIAGVVTNHVSEVIKSKLPSPDFDGIQKSYLRLFARTTRNRPL